MVEQEAGMAKQRRNRTEITDIVEKDFWNEFVLRVKFDESPRKLEPVMRYHDIGAVALMRKHGWLALEEELALLLTGAAMRLSTVSRVCSVISNLMGRPVFFWHVVARSTA
jgi:hypothetical protein